MEKYILELDQGTYQTANQLVRLSDLKIMLGDFFLQIYKVNNFNSGKTICINLKCLSFVHTSQLFFTSSVGLSQKSIITFVSTRIIKDLPHEVL